MFNGRQIFYLSAGGEPTPPITLKADAKVRKQEVRGKWTLVVLEEMLIEGETGIQGWVSSDKLSSFP